MSPSRRTNPVDRLVVVHCGPGDPPLAGAAVFRLTPVEATRDAAVDALASSGLSTSDTRTRVVFSTAATPDVSAVAWAAVVGFFGRLVDIVVADADGVAPSAVAVSHPGSHLAGMDVTVVAALARGLSAAAGELAGPPPPCVQFGGPSLVADVIEVEATPEGVVLLQRSRRARVVGHPDTATTLGRVAFAAVVRHRDGLDRLPSLVTGDEPFDVDAKSPGGVDLDAVRRSAYGIRRASRVDDRSAVAPPVELTARQRRIMAAAAVSVESALVALGVTRSSEERQGASSVWECPVVSHGEDAEQATLQVVRGAAQCVKCSRTKFDALRLVMWVRSCTADEACDLLSQSGLLADV